METETYTASSNHKYDRWMPHLEIKNLLNEVMSRCYLGLGDNAIFEPLKGEASKHGDYVCFGVLNICHKLRKKNRRLFYRKGPTHIAMEIKKKFEIMKKFESQKSEMIKRLILHDAGIFTFRLEERWMAERIENLLNDGIDTWAPTLSCKRALFFFPTNTIATAPENADMVRAMYIKDAFVEMFLYSGAGVGNGHFDDSSLKKVREHFTEKEGKIVSNRQQTSLIVLNGPSSDVYTDLATLWYAVQNQKPDWMVYITPHRLREYLEECLTAAAKEGWLPDDWKVKDTPTCCGFRTFSGQQQELSHLWSRYKLDARSLQRLGVDAGYTIEASFECALKFTCLKSHRLAECTFNFEDVDDTEGNTFVSLLKTRDLVRSLIKKSPSGNSFKLKALAGKERELGLLLVGFTEVIFRACATLLPHTVCEYLWNLSKLFTCYYREVPHSKNMLGLCKATEVVMKKCFDLLGIAPSLDRTCRFESCNYPKKARAISEADARNGDHLNSRLEILSMNVSVSNSDFDKGTVCGSVAVVDTYLAANEWVCQNEQDDCYVSYLKRDWLDPIDIRNGSYIPLGNPSCLHSIPVSSSIEASVLVIATSEKKDQTYLVCNCKATRDLTEFWAGNSDAMCGTLRFDGEDGCTLVDFVVIKEAVDTTMELRFNRVKPIRVRGSIVAGYGDDVLRGNGVLGQYNAIVFDADPTTFIGYKPEQELPLQKSTLAVPANGCLDIIVFLQDADSNEIIMDDIRKFRKSESVNGYSILKIEGKKGTFEFRVKWI